MASNQVKFKWGTAPSYEELQSTIEELGHNRPAPIIKIDIGAKDLKHGTIEALLALAGEHGIELSMSLTAQYGEGQQLMFWETQGRPANAPV